MAQINYNVLNETTWIIIVHTFMGNFAMTVIAKLTQHQWNTWDMMLLSYSGLPQQGKSN